MFNVDARARRQTATWWGSGHEQTARDHAPNCARLPLAGDCIPVRVWRRWVGTTRPACNTAMCENATGATGPNPAYAGEDQCAVCPLARQWERDTRAHDHWSSALPPARDGIGTSATHLVGVLSWCYTETEPAELPLCRAVRAKQIIIPGPTSTSGARARSRLRSWLGMGDGHHRVRDCEPQLGRKACAARRNAQTSNALALA